MHPLTHSVVAALLAGAAAAGLAFLLDGLGIDSRITLGLALAVFGVLDRLILEARRSHRRRQVLRESLRTFFRSMQQEKKAQPLWSELKRHIAEVHDVESEPSRRELLLAALAEATQLSHHISFLAVSELDTPALRKLKQSME